MPLVDEQEEGQGRRCRANLQRQSVYIRENDLWNEI